MGVFLSTEGNYTRQESLHWPGTPDAIGKYRLMRERGGQYADGLKAFSNPYIYSVVSVIPTPSSSSAGTTAPPTSAIQIHLGPSLMLRQTLNIPQPPIGGVAIGPLIAITSSVALTPAAAMREATKVLFATTSTDRTLSITEGSSIWALTACEVEMQIDELVKEGRVADAIGLVEAVGQAGLSPVS
jgi:hypothetical protein